MQIIQAFKTKRHVLRAFTKKDINFGIKKHVVVASSIKDANVILRWYGILSMWIEFSNYFSGFSIGFETSKWKFFHHAVYRKQFLPVYDSAFGCYINWLLTTHQVRSLVEVFRKQTIMVFHGESPFETNFRVIFGLSFQCHSNLLAGFSSHLCRV